MTEDIAVKALGALIASVILFILSKREAKLSRAIDEQLVFNAKITGAVDLVVEKINGHEALDSARHEAVTDRINSLEREVAHRTGRA